MKRNILVAIFFIVSATTFTVSGQSLSNDFFTLSSSDHGLGELRRTNDIHSTNYIRNRRVLGDLNIFYAHDEKVYSVQASEIGSSSFFLEDELIAAHTPVDSLKDPRLSVEQSFVLSGDSLTWYFTLRNNTDKQLRIEDLAVPLHYNSPRGETPEIIFEECVVKHQFVSGDNSYVFFQRPTGLGPYLLMTPLKGTSLEYYSSQSMFEGDRYAFKVFIHSAHSGNEELRGDWRQPHTMKIIQPKSSITFGFKFKWAAGYDGIRDLLVEQGLIDVEVMPGMTVPTDLETRIALRTKHDIDVIIPEFGGSNTVVTYLGELQENTHHYSIRFSKLGENKLKIKYGGAYQTQLEFFITEPLETLYKKRASFITNRTQHRDSTKWYDGLFGVYDMKNASLRGPDNPDYLDTTRLEYVLTCDDPGLCKAPFLAAKNVVFPDPKEIESIEYYIENFVWGGLQRTDTETPYEYGVYGTPNWLVNRNQKGREARENDPNRFRMHVWRSYDYPHIMMMYYHMFQIADQYPDLVSYADRDEYLLRAKETAKAYFKYPYEILPWYRTYEWGCYNELLIPELIEVLKKEGFEEDAQFLTDEWEKKVKYFIYDDKYPFRSEYAVDATAFESSYALAKYGVLNEMQPDEKLWYDKNDSVWYSHPKVSQEDAREFMDRQLSANLALRGVLEPTYYWLGSDFRGRSERYTLSYMSQMGGWSVLDQGLYFSDPQNEFIKIGYQSYLSSFALINSGTPESNYGYWYGGKENDGASGWAFEPEKYARSWIAKPQGRGPWFYDGEIDLGYGGALRAAATVVTNDRVFGLVAYGGELQQEGNVISVIPRDGLRRRFHIREGNNRIDLELGRDGLEKNAIVLYERSGKLLEFTIENRTGNKHMTPVTIRGLKGNYIVRSGGKTLHKSMNGSQMDLTINLQKDLPTVITLEQR